MPFSVEPTGSKAALLGAKTVKRVDSPVRICIVLCGCVVGDVRVIAPEKAVRLNASSVSFRDCGMVRKVSMTCMVPPSKAIS